MNETKGSTRGTAGIVAAAGIIGALLVVAWQIRENTAAVRAESSMRVTAQFGGAAMAWAQDPQFAALVARVRDEPTSLNGEERVRFEAYAIGLFNLWEQGFMVHQEGLMRDAVWQDWNGRMRSVVSQAALRALWPQVSTYYSAGFQTHVEGELATAAQSAGE